MQTALKDDARTVLQICGIPRGANFFALDTDQKLALLDQAAIRRYRHPKNANGSRARYFHDLMQRRAA